MASLKRAPSSKLLLASALSAVVCFLVGVEQEALANRGYVGGTGKPYPNNPPTCAACHGNGGSVVINAPTTMTANTTATVSVTVNSGNAQTSFNAAFTAGECTGGANTDVPFPLQNPDEVSPKGPQYTVNGGTATFTWTYRAPTYNTTVKMYAVGVGVNNNGANSGDGAAFATANITITGGTAQPPPDAGSASSGGINIDGGKPPTGSSSGTTSSGGTTASSGSTGKTGTSASSSGSSGSEEEEGPARRRSTGSDDGCSASPTLDASGGITGLLGMAMITYVLAKRRRRTG